jgi:hypothetical protein
MTDWAIILIIAGLVYKLTKLRVIHLEFGERDESKPTIRTKRKQLKK